MLFEDSCRTSRLPTAPLLRFRLYVPVRAGDFLATRGLSFAMLVKGIPKISANIEKEAARKPKLLKVWFLEVAQTRIFTLLRSGHVLRGRDVPALRQEGHVYRHTDETFPPSVRRAMSAILFGPLR